MKESRRTVTSESDRVCVWVHDGGECVARFGKTWFEVYGADRPRRQIAWGSSLTLEGWRTFKDCVLGTFAYALDDALAPVRLHGEMEPSPGFEPGDQVFLVPVREISDVTDPFLDDVWGRGTIMREDVRRLLEAEDVASDFVEMHVRERLSAEWDARRTAYFVRNPSAFPISIEVVSPEGDFEVDDGYHRLAAAIYRGDGEIAVELGGYVGGWSAAFPGRRPLEARARNGTERSEGERPSRRLVA